MKVLRTQCLDQGLELFDFGGLEVRQGRAHRASAAAHHRGPGLDDAHRIAFSLVADLQIRQEEVLDQAAHGGLIALGVGVVEGDGRARDEVEHRRRIRGHAQRAVGVGVDLVRGHAAHIHEAITQAVADGDDALDITQAVLESDQVGAGVGQDLQGRRAELAGAAVVDDQAYLHTLAHRLHVRDQSLLRGLGQVMRQQQVVLVHYQVMLLQMDIWLSVVTIQVMHTMRLLVELD